MKGPFPRVKFLPNQVDGISVLSVSTSELGSKCIGSQVDELLASGQIPAGSKISIRHGDSKPPADCVHARQIRSTLYKADPTIAFH